MQFQGVALTPPNVKFSIKDFFSKCIQIRKFTGKRIFCSLFLSTQWDTKNWELCHRCEFDGNFQRSILMKHVLSFLKFLTYFPQHFLLSPLPAHVHVLLKPCLFIYLIHYLESNLTFTKRQNKRTIQQHIMYQSTIMSLRKKCSFPLRISSLNVTKIQQQ